MEDAYEVIVDYYNIVYSVTDIVVRRFGESPTL